MPITKPKKKRREINFADRSVQEITRKGGEVSRAAVNNSSDRPKSIQLRLYDDQIAEIDILLAQRTGRHKMSRHAWIVQAIEEKLEREQQGVENAG